MKSIEFTGEFLDEFFEDNFIEDEALWKVLKGRRGKIEEVTQSFENEDDEHMALQITLVMGEV